MREIVARRPRARALRRGDAPALRRPGPGAARRRDGRAPGGRAGHLRRDLRLAEWRPGNFQPVSIAWGEPMTLRRPPDGRQGLQGGVGEIAGARSGGSGTGSSSVHELGRPRDATAAVMTRRSRRRPEIAGTVAIVGFPNVGKSTLVNRLTATRAAVVHETPGVTRDRKELLCEWNGNALPAHRHGRRRHRRRRAVRRADRRRRRARRSRRPTSSSSSSTRRPGSRPATRSSPRSCARRGKPVLVLANKIDDPRRDLEALEFHRLGLGDPIPLSALHGHGTGDLLDEIVARLPGHGRAPVGEEAIRVAILGRPNVGKSSLLNALLGEERVIVSEVPGTTRDAIDTVLRARRHDVRPRRHGRAAPQAQAAAGDRVLLGAARARGRRARRRRARPRRRERGHRRPGPRRRGRRAQGAVLDARRPLEVGRHRDRHRGRAAARSQRACASGRR